MQLMLITSDKGLAGAFNSNLIKAAQRFAEEHQPAATDFCADRPQRPRFFPQAPVRRSPANIWACAKVQYEDAAAIAQKLMERFRNEEIDAVYLLYNEFKSVMAQKVDPHAGAAGGVAQEGRAGGFHLRSSRRWKCWPACCRATWKSRSTARCWNPPRPSMPRA